MLVSPDKGPSGNPQWFVKDDYRYSLYIDHGRFPIYQKSYDLESHGCGYAIISPTRQLLREGCTGKVLSILTILESDIIHIPDVDLAIHGITNLIRKGDV